MEPIRTALSSLLFFTVVCGLGYPALITGLAQLTMPHRANGSLIERDGAVIGSELLGQPFGAAGYFWSRPSATSAHPYDAAASSGSNLGPLHPALGERVAARVTALGGGPVPVDLVTTSGSGLDPHVSPAAALFQVARVARARGVDEARVRALVEEHVEERTLGVWGAPRVNVLRLNLALDEALGPPSTPAPAGP